MASANCYTYYPFLHLSCLYFDAKCKISSYFLIITLLSIDKIESSSKQEGKRKITSTKSIFSKDFSKIPLLHLFLYTLKLLYPIQILLGLFILKGQILPIFLIVTVKYILITMSMNKKNQATQLVL